MGNLRVWREMELVMPAPPDVQRGSLRYEEVAPGVWAASHPFIESKTGIIAAGDVSVVVDTGNGRGEGEEIDAFAARRPVQVLVLTHGHYDHILGSGPFVGRRVVAHEQCTAVMTGTLDQQAAKTGLSPAALREEWAWPSDTVDAATSLTGVARAIRLLPFPGHSPDGLCVWLPDERVLYAGDTVSTAILPAFDDGSSDELLASLAQLRQLEARVLVAGHGPVVHGEEAVRDALEWPARYLERVRAFVGERLDGGAGLEEIVEAADFAELVGCRFSPDRHNMTTRHARAVAKVVAELRTGQG